MPHRDPYALIRETADRIRRRTQANLTLPTLPPLVVCSVLLASGKLPVEIAAAALIGSAVLLLLVSSESAGERAAAGRIDRSTDARDRFLTLATLEPSSAFRFRTLVESEAADLAAGVRPAELVQPLERRLLGWSGALSLLLLVGFWFQPAGPPVIVSATGRLEDIARELENGSAADRQLAQTIRSAIEVLRDPARSATEKREALEQSLQQIERQSRDGRGSAEQPGSGQTKSDELRGQAKNELRQAAGEQAGASGAQSGGSKGTKQEEGEKKDASGGEVNAPGQPKAVGEREGDATGNQPAPDQAKTGEPRTAGDASERGDASKPEGDSSGESGSERRPQPGTAGQGSRAASDEPQAERLPEAGEGGDGWRVVNGEYVRVRIPEEGGAAETERVPRPGRVEPEVEYRNAPLPSAGKPGEVHQNQAVPLEYRSVLAGETQGER